MPQNTLSPLIYFVDLLRTEISITALLYTSQLFSMVRFLPCAAGHVTCLVKLVS